MNFWIIDNTFCSSSNISSYYRFWRSRSKRNVKTNCEKILIASSFLSCLAWVYIAFFLEILILFKVYKKCNSLWSTGTQTSWYRRNNWLIKIAEQSIIFQSVCPSSSPSSIFVLPIVFPTNLLCFFGHINLISFWYPYQRSQRSWSTRNVTVARPACSG